MKKNKRSNNIDNQKLYAFLSSFFTIIGFIVALILWKDDKYVMHYAKQGLILFIGQIIIVVLSPFLLFISPILWILWIVLWVVTWINSLSGKMRNTFLIGSIAEKLSI